MVKCGQHESQIHGGYGQGNATGGVQSRFDDGVLYVTGLEGTTQGGVWNDNLEITLA